MTISLQMFHRRINDVLLVVVLLLGLYLVAMPVLPEVQFYVQKKAISTDMPLLRQFVPRVPKTLQGPHSTEKRLQIPSILVDGEILSGDLSSLLDQGIWHRPHSSTPDKGGNTVFVAHRFQYTSGPNTFYHLEKVALGETITVIWEGVVYEYEVADIQIVGPNEMWVEEDTSESIITLYTCTPLWTAEQRLVVRGKLVS